MNTSFTSQEYREKQFRARARGGQTLIWFIIAIVWLWLFHCPLLSLLLLMLMLMSVLKSRLSSLGLIESASQSGQTREKTATNSIKISSKICKNAPKAKTKRSERKILFLNERPQYLSNILRALSCPRATALTQSLTRRRRRRRR